jgi:tetratricopeptide (TPR) repeat protein
MRRALALLLASLAVAACDLRAAKRTDDPALARTISELTTALGQSPNDLVLRRRLADAHLAAEHWFVAAEIYKQVVDVTPEDGLALAGLSDAYLKLALYPQAFEALSRGVTAAEGGEECMLRLGLLLRGDGSPEGLVQARSVLARFVDRAPQHPRIEEARAALRELDVQIATTPGAAAIAGTSSTAGAPAGAASGTSPSASIPAHQGAAGQAPVGQLNPFGVAFGRALEAVRKSDAPGAEAALLEALKYQPDDVSALALLSETYLVMNRPDDARRYADKAYATNPRDSQARWAFGLVHVRTRGDVGRALEAWRALAKDDPDFAEQAGVTRSLAEAERMLAAPGAGGPGAAVP